ncbi:MAG: heavy metal translocating P-type ATPase [Thaumarchaeota archaeon]|nr:heavy metal translocating P-type ATPase [Nitrososphaerota archaeon]
MAKDPVCGMYVEEKQDALKAVRSGSTYYFCSDVCLQTFVAPARELRRIRSLALLSFALGIPVLLFTWFVATPGWLPRDLLLFVLATPVQFIAGWVFYRGAWHAIRARVANMDTLVALGTSAAWFYSTVVVFVPGVLPEGVYFDASSLIIGFILLGKVLEHSARGRASDAVRKLLDLSPKYAVVIRDGIEVEVPVEEVQVGDLIRVKPGDKIPTDGVVAEGSGAVDEKMLTGESIPVGKQVGDEVYGATINKSGLLKVRATKVGSDTALAQIVKLVDEAHAGQVPVQRLVDRIASYFVPTVVLVAVGAFVAWDFLLGRGVLYGFTAFIAVLIVACPCALGLATPAAIVVGTAKGAANGILLKGGEQLERASKVDQVVFDKTGTITRGDPSVTDLVIFGEETEQELLGLAASAEEGSEHPLGKAILRRARHSGGSISPSNDFQAEAGSGVTVRIHGKEVLVGNRRLFASRGIVLGEADAAISSLEAQGKTAIIVGLEGRVVGVIAVSDTVKPGAKEAVGSLMKLGVRVAMLTGDNTRTARAIADEVGIREVYAEVFPARKSEIIKKLKEEGRVVAMVGDGINDAPALAEADVGMAIGSGTDVAIETAGIVLMKDDLKDVVGAIRLSKATMAKIKQNLFWAFAYNTVLIPVAALGILNPILAGVAMALSSVSVVANSLSIRRVKLTP